MSERKSRSLSRRHFLEGSVGAVVGVSVGCGGDDTTETPVAGTGGQPGGTVTGTGASTGAGATGGLPTTGPGGSPTSAGGAATGGTSSAGTSSVTGGAGTGGSGSTENALVTLVRASDWRQATMDAVLARLPDLTGQVVMVRPNLLEARPDGTTNPEVIAGVVAAAKQRGASEIIVGDDTASGDAVSNMQTLGITDAVGSDATCVSLAGGATTNYSDPNTTAWPDGIDIYNAVKDADYVINVPRCKTHGFADFTMFPESNCK